MTKQNGRCPLQQECERICKVVGHERHCDYYVNNRHGTSGIPDQDKILDEEDARKTREWEEKYFAVLDEDEETDGTEPTGDSKRMEPAAAVCEAETSGGGIKAALPAPFDYSGLDVQTVEVLHLAEREIRKARQVYICRVSAAVAAAHEAVVANCDDSKHGNRGEHAFINWCASVGLKKDAAYRLLQVNALLTGATPEEQATLEAASPSLLYAAARPSAPAELVQGVKTGDITTHKQYQELLAEIRTRDAKISELTEASEASDRRADAAERRAREAEAQRTAVLDKQGEYITRIHALESRPVEVAVQEPDPAEVERMAEEKARAMTAGLRGQLKTAEGNIQRMKSIRDSLQSQLEDWQRAASRQATALTAENVLPMAQDLAGNIKSLYNTFLLAAHGLHGEDYRRCAAPLAQALEEALGGLRANTAQYTANRYEEDEDFE